MRYIEARRDLITERVPSLPLALYVNVHDRTMAVSMPVCREFD